MFMSLFLSCQKYGFGPQTHPTFFPNVTNFTLFLDAIASQEETHVGWSVGDVFLKFCQMIIKSVDQ